MRIHTRCPLNGLDTTCLACAALLRVDCSSSLLQMLWSTLIFRMKATAGLLCPGAHWDVCTFAKTVARSQASSLSKPNVC